MKKTFFLGSVLLTGLGFTGQALAEEPIPPDVKSDYSVSQEAWAGGMQSGAGNYTQNCMPCHGMDGKGDGPLAESLGGDMKPRDLSNAALLSNRTDDFLFKVIKFGGKKSGLSEAMPDWGETFDDEAIKNIVRYLRESICNCQYAGGGS